MSKIVLAINSMIANANKISDVIRNEDEFLFKYNNKYIWGIKQNAENFYLFYYPETKDVKELANIEQYEWENVIYITYRSEDLKTREALESFRELYLIVKEKLFNTNQVLDDIIGNSAK